MHNDLNTVEAYCCSLNSVIQCSTWEGQLSRGKGEVDRKFVPPVVCGPLSGGDCFHQLTGERSVQDPEVVNIFSHISLARIWSCGIPTCKGVWEVHLAVYLRSKKK